MCRYGGKCQFAHGAGELRALNRHPKYKTEVCRTFSLTGGLFFFGGGGGTFTTRVCVGRFTYIMGAPTSLRLAPSSAHL